jgi:hypothetical protein
MAEAEVEKKLHGLSRRANYTHYATGWKVTGLIADEFNELFNLPNL